MSEAQATGRLAWRCRRGMKELDLALLRYLEGPWQVAGAAERACFEQILDLPDPLLAAYLTGREPAADKPMQELVDALRQAAAHPVAGSGARGPAIPQQP